MMRGPALHTAEDATRQELRGASLRLMMWLVICVILGPLVRAMPLGQTTRTGILAWLLVAMALYWLYAGLGYRPLLLIQLIIFSTAAALLAIKAGFVALGVKEELDILRASARFLLIIGGLCAGANLGMMLIASLRRRPPPGSDQPGG